MMKRLIAIALMTGACSALPHQDGSTVVPLIETPVNPEKGQFDPQLINPEGVFNPVYPEIEPYNPKKVAVDPERGALYPEKGPEDPEKGPFPVPNVPLPNDGSEDIPDPQHGPKPESDLKTDATFWPFYRSFWGYPTYRSYSWGYPYYRYYRPRTYYRNYYW